MDGNNHPAMPSEIKFLSIRLRAIAQATEVEERVLRAMIFAAGTEAITVTKTEGHFGTPIVIFEAELKKTAEIRRFNESLAKAGILSQLRTEADQRTDEGCAFHFRLGKQDAFLGTLALASDHDVIDVRMKIGVYPAKREEAVRLLTEWMAEMSA